MTPPCPLVPRGGGCCCNSRGLVPPPVARGVSSTVPSASAPGIGPPAPLAGGPLGAIIGGHPLPRDGVAEWFDPPIMRFAYALHMRQQNLVPFPCLYIVLFELYRSHLPLLHHHASLPQNILFQCPFRHSRSERLNDASMLLVSLIFL